MRRANERGWVPHVGIGRRHVEVATQEERSRLGDARR